MMRRSISQGTLLLDMAISPSYLWAPPPTTCDHAHPPVRGHGNAQWVRNNQSYVNVVSFGFVASAILISMFLVMAIFERLLRPRAPLQPILPTTIPPTFGGQSHRVAMLPTRTQLVARTLKADHPLSNSAQGIPVLMPGQDIPSFIARPAPVPMCKSSSISMATWLGKSCPGSSSSQGLNLKGP